MEESVVGDFANRLKYEFEDRASDASDSDGSQDWFVNDKATEENVELQLDGELRSKDDGTRDAALVASPTAATTPKLTVSDAKPAMNEERDTCCNATGQTAFLQHTPPTLAVLVMEVATGPEVHRYGTRFFRFYVPQVHDSQVDFCLFARKRQGKHKFRFSLDENFESAWSDPFYGGKVLLTPSTQAKRFKLVAAKPAGRVQFDIEQEARKQELLVRLNSQAKRFSFLRGRSAPNEESDVYRSNIQKFINPITDVRCPKTNYTLFKMEKEGETGMEKYIVTYTRPFSLFVSCCLAVGVEAHLLEG